LWRDIYAKFPSKDCVGADIADRLFYRVSHDELLVAEDIAGVVQAFARFRRTAEKKVYLEELIVAPWNNRRGIPCSKEDKPVQDLALVHRVRPEEVLRSHSGVGTLMIYALCRFGVENRLNELALTSRSEAKAFYERLGMQKVEGEDRLFIFELSRGIPEALLKVLRKYFPIMAAL
jgi:hypothetical protein